MVRGSKLGQPYASVLISPLLESILKECIKMLNNVLMFIHLSANSSILGPTEQEVLIFREVLDNIYVSAWANIM